MGRVSIGDTVGGRYRLERQIGEGGMASVWRAQDLTLERPVALKFLFAYSERERDAIADEFLREAKLAASVRHRNVVQTLDFGRHAEGVPFMVMELLEGDSLGDRFDRGEMFDVKFIVELLAEALQGLAAVHDAGIVHRDLKPENIFLVRERGGIYPKILDFGISKSVDPASGRRSAVTTRDGRVIGTPEYMSPEQARGLAAIDRRTDIYSMGVVCYEALAGQAPFESENHGDLMMMVIQGEAEPLATLVPELGRPLSDAVHQAMHRDREQRYPDAMAMRDALLGALEQTIEGYRKRSGAPPPMRSRHRAARSERTFRSTPQAAASAPARGPSGPAPAWFSPVGIASVAALGLIAAVSLFLWRTQDTQAPPRFIVVQGDAPALEPASTPQPPPPPLVEAPARSVEPEPALAAAPSAQKPTPARARIRSESARPSETASQSPGADAASALTREFHRQMSSAVHCFDRFPAGIDEGASLSLRVALEASGRVHEVAITPVEVAAGELGRCVRDAVLAMRFGPQAEAIAFRVPITARRTSPPK